MVPKLADDDGAARWLRLSGRTSRGRFFAKRAIFACLLPDMALAWPNTAPGEMEVSLMLLTMRTGLVALGKSRPYRQFLHRYPR